MAFNPQVFDQGLGGNVQDLFTGGGVNPQQDAFMQMLSQFIKEGRLNQFDTDNQFDQNGFPGEEEGQQGLQPQNSLQDITSQLSLFPQPGGLFNNISSLMPLLQLFQGG